MMVRSSRVDQPPVSGVPVAGATRRGGMLVWGWMGLGIEGEEGWVGDLHAGSKVSMSMER